MKSMVWLSALVVVGCIQKQWNIGPTRQVSPVASHTLPVGKKGAAPASGVVRAYPSAEYNIERQGAELADARVWSQVFVDRVAGQERPVLHVGIQAESKVRTPLVIMVPLVDLLT